MTETCCLCSEIVNSQNRFKKWFLADFNTCSVGTGIFQKYIIPKLFPCVLKLLKFNIDLSDDLSPIWFRVISCICDDRIPYLVKYFFMRKTYRKSAAKVFFLEPGRATSPPPPVNNVTSLNCPGCQ